MVSEEIKKFKANYDLTAWQQKNRWSFVFVFGNREIQLLAIRSAIAIIVGKSLILYSKLLTEKLKN